MSHETKDFYEFGEFRFEIEKRVLWRGEEIASLSPKALEVLSLLLDKRGNLVERQEILDTVWSDSFVEEGNLNHAISALRKTLGSDFIQTIPRRGYLFTGEVRRSGRELGEIVIERRAVSETLIEETISDDTVSPDVGGHSGVAKTDQLLASGRLAAIDAARKSFARPLAMAALLLIVTVGAFAAWRYMVSGSSQIRSIAVLPLRNLSESENERSVSLGLTEALINRLGGLNRFAVRPLSATQKFSADGQDPLSVGEELRVDAVLEGSLQSVNDRLRVNVRLLRVADGSQIWGGSFDESETDIFKLQDLLSAQVANSVVDRLTPAEHQHLVRRSTDNLEAYKLYLKGRYFWNQRSVEAYFKAIEYFEQSIRLDPGFALGYSGIADCYSLLEQRGGLPPHEAYPKAEEAARRALELDDTLAEAHASIGLIKALYRWDWHESEMHYRRALELNPNFAAAYGSYGMNLLCQKRFDEAEASMRKGESLDPTSRSIAIYLAWKFYFAREFDRAIEQSLKALELDPNLTTPYMILRSSYEQKGMFDEAVKAELKRMKGVDARTIESLENAYQKSGIKGFWEKQVETFISQAGGRGEVADYNLATRLALLGRNDDAIREMEKGFISRGSMWHQIAIEPAFEPLGHDARFQALLRKLNLP